MNTAKARPQHSKMLSTSNKSRNTAMNCSKTSSSIGINNIHDRLYNQKLGHLKDETIKEIEHGKMRVEKELTFQPRQIINSQSSNMLNKRKRSAVEFYNDQVHFQNKKVLQIEKLRKQIEERENKHLHSSCERTKHSANQSAKNGRIQSATKHSERSRSNSPMIETPTPF